MRQHQHLPASHLRKFRKDHGLSCARWQTDHHAPDTAAARCEHCSDGIALVGTKTDWAFRHLIGRTLRGGRHCGKVTQHPR
jgi:hypothetical protein